MFVIGLFVWNSGKLPVDNATQGIARIIRVEGSGTINASTQLENGMEIFSDADLSMKKGLVEIAYRNTGVHMIATAPLEMHLESDMQLMLNKGEVKLVVPPHAKLWCMFLDAYCADRLAVGGLPGRDCCWGVRLVSDAFSGACLVGVVGLPSLPSHLF